MPDQETTARVDPGDIYICAVCGTPDVATSAHDDNRAEQASAFTGDAGTDDDVGVVCDDCWWILLTRIDAEAPELLSAPMRDRVGRSAKCAGIRERYARTGKWWP